MRLTARPVLGLLALVAGAAGALATTGWFVRSDADPVSELSRAVGSSLPFEGRLTGFEPSRRSARRGVTAADGDGLPPDARIAIATLEKRAAVDPAPRTLAAVGVGYLAQGDVERAVATLEGAAREGDAAATWSDLSVAYLARAQRTPARRVEYLSRALESAAKSLRLSRSDEAAFNRALATERLAPYLGPIDPWSEYLSVERDPRWIETAKRHAGGAPAITNASERWERSKSELQGAFGRGDASAVRDIVAAFPEAASEMCERELLPAWANGSAAALEHARIVSAAIEAVTGDRLLRDEVERIQSRGRALAGAHIAYAEGLASLEGDRLQEAAASLVRAASAFQRARSPYGLWAEVQLSTIAFQRRMLEEADRRLTAVERSARAHEYPSLLGRALWVHGLVYSKQWRLAEAISSFRAAAETFENSRQLEAVVSLHGHLADALRTLGEHQDSWEYLGRTLEGLPRVRKPIRRYLFLYNASLFASSQSLLEAALMFQNAALAEAGAIGNGPAIEALTQRAAIFIRRGEYGAADADLAEVRRLIVREPNERRRLWAGAELAIVASELSSHRGANADTGGLAQALAFFAIAEPSMVPRLQLALGRAEIRTGDLAGAEESFKRGIERLEAQQSTLDDEALRVSYFDESWSLFPEMIEFQLARRHDDAAAFAYAERSRARSLLARSAGRADVRPSRLTDIQAALSSSIVQIYYVTLADRLEVWTITSDGSRRMRAAIRREALTTLVERHRAAVTSLRPDFAAGEQLYDLLIRPAAGGVPEGATIVVVPDGDLQRVPFPTLRDRATGRFLIEEHPVAVSPSASFYSLNVERWRNRPLAAEPKALLIGNPAAAPTSSATSAPLPGSEAEVVDASRLYARPALLVGREATKSRFLDLAPDYDVVHFGGHAVMNAEFPLLSRLVFSPGPGLDQNPLFAYEIAAMRFARTRLVILAACSTGSGSVSLGEGVMSIARPFLAAGVPTVVASQWDVDDRTTEQLFASFHRSFRHSNDPVGALQAAQIEALRSGDPARSAPASWGAFVVLGAVAR